MLGHPGWSTQSYGIGECCCDVASGVRTEAAGRPGQGAQFAAQVQRNGEARLHRCWAGVRTLSMQWNVESLNPLVHHDHALSSEGITCACVTSCCSCLHATALPKCRRSSGGCSSGGTSASDGVCRTRAPGDGNTVCWRVRRTARAGTVGLASSPVLCSHSQITAACNQASSH